MHNKKISLLYKNHLNIFFQQHHTQHWFTISQQHQWRVLVVFIHYSNESFRSNSSCERARTNACQNSNDVTSALTLLVLGCIVYLFLRNLLFEQLLLFGIISDAQRKKIHS